MLLTKTSMGLISVLMLAYLAFGCSASRVQGAEPAPNTLRFDAAWWQHINSGEQQGFIYGYQDCRQPPKAARASINDYQNAVSGTLESEKTSDVHAVTKAIERAWTTLASRDTRGGETYRGPHGYLDGEWWGEYTGTWPAYATAMDRGYTEGYLQCSSAPVTSKMVSRYQEEINQHYASGNHSHDKIAEVFQKFMKLSATPKN